VENGEEYFELFRSIWSKWKLRCQKKIFIVTLIY